MTPANGGEDPRYGSVTSTSRPANGDVCVHCRQATRARGTPLSLRNGRSHSPHGPPDERTRRARATLDCLLPLLGLVLTAAVATAQEPTKRETSTLEGLDDLADAIVWMTTRRWEGPRTTAPEPQARPIADYRLDAPLVPISVHAEASVPVAKAQNVLDILIGAAARLESEGWPSPLFDGGLGGTRGFDLYLSPTDALADARSDGRMVASYLDAAIAHAVVDPSLEGIDLESAVISAYSQALALNLDPAEARQWRRATGAWLAWRATGQMGPAQAEVEQQQQSWRSWISGAADDGSGGALLLAMLSERHDGGTGTFVRDVWQLARQRTWEGHELRAAPDLWQAFDRALSLAGEQLHALVEDLAAARWFLGARDQHTLFPALAGLGPDATVQPLFSFTAADMPAHSGASMPLQPFGSGYALVDVRDAPAQSRLRVWLRGEYGVEWALSASRLDAAGRELARVSAPPRRGDRRSYVPVELTEDTTHVMVCVTNLSHRLPDADDPDPNERAFRLIFDLVQEGHEPDDGAR